MRRYILIMLAVVALTGSCLSAGLPGKLPISLHNMQIVWSSRAYLPGKKQSFTHLWRMNGDGSGKRQITFGKHDYELREIHRSRRLRYFRDDYLWESDLDGKHARRLRHVVPEDWYVAEKKAPRTLTSPDGRWQYKLTRSDNDPASEVSAIVDKSTGATRHFSENESGSATWSPRSDVLAIIVWETPGGNLDDLNEVLVLVDPFEVKKERVQCPEKLIDEGVVTWPLLWSPDGRFICLSIHIGHDLHSLWIYDRSTRKWKHIQSAEDASWSPSGSFLLYKSCRDLAPFDGKQLWISHIYVYDAPAGITHQLTTGVTLNTDPKWLPVNMTQRKMHEVNYPGYRR